MIEGRPTLECVPAAAVGQLIQKACDIHQTTNRKSLTLLIDAVSSTWSISLFNTYLLLLWWERMDQARKHQTEAR